MLELLRERKFSTVVIIDDDNALPPLDTIDAIAREIVNAKPRRRRQLSALAFFADACALAEPNPDVESIELQANVRAWLDSNESNLTTEMKVQAAKILFEGKTGPTHEKLRGVIRETDITLRPFSFGGWQSSGREILAAATSEARVLLLVDDINDKERDVDLDGRRVLRDVFADASNELPFIDAIMVTSSCEPANELERAHVLYQEISDLLTENGHSQTFKKVFALSKTRLDDGTLVESFKLHLNRLEASRLSIELADATKDVLIKAVHDSLDWLKKIPLTEFHHSVFVTAQMEGAAEIDTLVRLASIRQRVALDALLRSDDNVQNRIEAMRKFTSSEFGVTMSSESSNALKELRQQEFERPGTHVNLLRVPLACGDVFKFNAVDSNQSPREFTAMLLVNPCDLMLRQDGKRKLTNGLLVRVEKVSRARAEEIAEEEKAHSPLLYRLATGSEPDDIAYLFFNSKVETVPLQVLDLCWTNTSGIAKLVPSEYAETISSLTVPQQARLNILSSRADAGRFTHLELWGADLRVEVGQAGTAAQGAMEYGITREWRLAPEFSAAALSALSQAISRPAFGHDYRQH